MCFNHCWQDGILLVNGIVIDTINLSKNYAVNPAASSLAIGASGYSFDEIRMFNKVRTADEIKQSMDKILSSTTPNLIGYWNFDDAVAYEIKEVRPSRTAVPVEYVILDESSSGMVTKSGNAPSGNIYYQPYSNTDTYFNIQWQSDVKAPLLWNLGIRYR